MEIIRCMVVDDIAGIREHFCDLINQQDDMEVVCVAETGRGAVKRALEFKPDIILMDIQLDYDTAGVDATEKIMVELPTAKIIIVTSHNNDKFILDTYLYGAVDYILKEDSSENILSTIREVYRNNNFIGPLLAAKLREGLTIARNREESLLFFINNYSKLTNTERRILKHLYSNKKRREISEIEFISMETVKSHISHILKKLGMGSTAEIVRFLKKVKFFDEFDI